MSSKTYGAFEIGKRASENVDFKNYTSLLTLSPQHKRYSVSTWEKKEHELLNRNWFSQIQKNEHVKK